MKSLMFDAVILMGGFGTRLKSVSGATPKPMMPVAGEPFVYILLRNLEAAGCKRIFLSVHYAAEAIKRKILEDKPVTCELVFIYEDEPLGTGGALKHVAHHVPGEYFIALNGDTFSALDLQDFAAKNIGEELVIAGLTMADASRYGTLLVDDDSRLIDMSEKGVSGRAVINSGTYLIKKSPLIKMSLNAFSLEEIYIPSKLDVVKVHLFEGDFIDIGIPEDYQLACEYFS